jgi:hypothetical protein
MVIKENKSNKELKFPCLMESNNGNVFLVLEEKVSVFLKGIEVSGFKPGEICYPNANKLNMYKGEITISNN